MNNLIDSFKQTYYYYINDLADARTNKLPLIYSPFPICCLLIIYYVFVKFIGPKYMENRAPFNLKKVLIIYNIFQVLMNAYMFQLCARIAYNLNWRCAPVDYSNSEIGLSSVFGGYLYFLNKLLDLLDTVFFVLRKNQRQITFLHVYHHILITLLAYVGMKYICGGHSIYVALLNTIVHTVMYFYYFLTIYDKKYKNKIWWKKYITQMQLIQFALIFAIFLPPLFVENCAYPRLIIYILLPQYFFFTYLFGKFYYITYMKTTKDIKTR